MDNIKLAFKLSKIDESKVLAFLRAKKIPVTNKDKGKASRSFIFTRWVGVHKSKWFFTVYPDKGSVVCSGGPTTTFFGFNNWVSLAEHLQMQAIVTLLKDKLNDVDGLEIDEGYDPDVQRIEITHLYQFNALSEIKEVQSALYPNLIARFEGRVQLVGETLTVPGMLRVGLTKSTTLLRIYPEDSKFQDKPEAVSEAKWAKFKRELQYCLRVESIFNAAQLEAAELSKASAWESRKEVLKLVDKRMKDAGLRDVNRQDEALLEQKVNNASRAEKDLILDWKAGKVVKANGTWSRAQAIAKECGYDLTIPYSAQDRIAHGYASSFAADKVYELPLKLRKDKELFSRWWEN